jgi:Alr-MurF fusion protein
MQYNAQQIATITNGEIFGKSTLICEGICIDTRKRNSQQNEMFVALNGLKSNGHQFIPSAIESGIKLFLVDTLPSKISEAHCYIKTSNTLEALQKLARYHRNTFQIPVIGITGSNGKTIIKEWLYQLLSKSKNVCASPNSYNSQIGVALSVLLLNQTNDIALFEAGISKVNEMQQLQEMIQPSIGILSNIGSAHDEGFINQTEKLAEKLKLFGENCTVIYCLEQIQIKNALQVAKAVTWTNQAANKNIATYFFKIEKKGNITHLTYENIILEIPFTDNASIENICHCLACLLYLKINLSTLTSDIKTLKPLNNRLEIKKGINGNNLINDSYSNDLVSLNLALQFQSENNLLKQNKVLILSDLLQGEKNKEKLYGQVSDTIKQNNISQLIGIGKDINEAAEQFKLENKIFFNDTETFLKSFNYRHWFNQSILLKGARVFAFERIDQVLQQKTHETILEINLNAFIHNLNFYRSLLKTKTKIMAMVKAFAYGSGSIEIANVLQQQQVDYLAVAFVDEGIELRQAGITLPIMVMNPDAHSFEQMSDYDLEPEIFSFKILNQFITHIKNLKQQNKNSNTAVHLKIDTGMHRLGFEPSEIETLINTLRNNDIQVATIFSHFAASDNSDLDNFTAKQITLFSEIGNKIKSELKQDAWLHLANTSGIARHVEAHFDMVRLGIGLYGVANSNKEQKQLQLAGILLTVISQIKIIPSGETVGYSRSGKIDKLTKIATIPIGYADGFSRQLSNGQGQVYIHHKIAKVIGNVCMDMCMVDVTDIACEEGDSVVVYENIEQLNSLATSSKTIAYEILTNVSARVKRVYVNL